MCILASVINSCRATLLRFGELGTAAYNVIALCAFRTWVLGLLASRGESRNRSFRSAARCCQQPTRWSFGTAARCTRSGVRAFVLHRFGAIRNAIRNAFQSLLRPA